MLVNPLKYPTNSDFIAFNSQKASDRLAKCGFPVTQVILFEIPFCPISGVGAASR